MSLWGVVVPIVSVLLLYGIRMKELGTKRETVSGPVQEFWTLRLFILAGTLMLAGSITEFLWRGERLRWLTFLAGWGCAALSVALRRWAITALGQFWSLHVEIRQNHPFIQSGPFRWMRHPTYFSMILELLAIGLILNVIYLIPIVAVIFVPTLLVRLRLEEAALVEKFGQAYHEYRRRTPALFPYKYPKRYDSPH